METQKKPARSRKRRSKTSEFVQDFLPVREIRNGIIETTDDRYVKIIEILPINFLLRSSEEQYNIISYNNNYGLRRGSQPRLFPSQSRSC